MRQKQIIRIVREIKFERNLRGGISYLVWFSQVVSDAVKGTSVALQSSQRSRSKSTVHPHTSGADGCLTFSSLLVILMLLLSGRRRSI